jgi:hypothetical protein
MPDRQEVMSSLYGAYRLACFDENGLNYFNISVEGFWRSFAAIFFVLPAYILLVGQGVGAAAGGFSIWTVMVHMVSELLGWVIFALVAFVATDMLKLGHRYTALIVAVNWGSVIVVSALVVGLGVTLLLPAGPSGMIIVAMTVAIIIYQWFVIRTALQTTGTIALAFVLFSLVTGVMLEQTTSRLL